LYWFESLADLTKYRTGINFESIISEENMKNKYLEVNQKLK